MADWDTPWGGGDGAHDGGVMDDAYDGDTYDRDTLDDRGGGGGGCYNCGETG